MDAYNQTWPRRPDEPPANRGSPHYSAPVGLNGALGIESPYTLAADEYFVLGDNSLVAVDSRYPGYGPIRAEALVGSVLGVR